MTQQAQEEFATWWEKQPFKAQFEEVKQQMCNVWVASRAEAVVDLPPLPQVPEDPEEAIDDSHMDAYHSAVRMRSACAKSIKAAGLKVKE